MSTSTPLIAARRTHPAVVGVRRFAGGLFPRLGLLALALAMPGNALAQFAYIHRDTERIPPAAEADVEEIPPGPAGPLLSTRFAAAADDWKLHSRRPIEWRHDLPNWIDEEQFVTPPLFDGERPSPNARQIPTVGRLHTTQEWRAWRRQRRRWSDSWGFFPIHLTKFSGLMQTSEPIHDRIKHGDGSLTGVRLGWDFASHWGTETRVGYARQALRDEAQAGSLGHENFILWDADLLFYPFGDRPWRPYLLAGLGIADVKFIDSQSVYWHQTLLSAPVGAGLQYRFNNRAALRLDVVDNMVLRSNAGGGGRHLQHDLSVSFGFEARFAYPHKNHFEYPHSRLDRLKVFLPYH
jgi:hypothetical protein